MTLDPARKSCFLYSKWIYLFKNYPQERNYLTEEKYEELDIIITIYPIGFMLQKQEGYETWVCWQMQNSLSIKSWRHFKTMNYKITIKRCFYYLASFSGFVEYVYQKLLTSIIGKLVAIKEEEIRVWFRSKYIAWLIVKLEATLQVFINATTSKRKRFTNIFEFLWTQHTMFSKCANSWYKNANFVHIVYNNNLNIN